MTARFAPGAAVAVRRADPPGHIRAPWYIRGKRGVVERVCGSFPNPEEGAFGRSGLPAVPLYRVRFAQPHVWPDYAGPATDTLDVEIYEHWLEAGLTPEATMAHTRAAHDHDHDHDHSHPHLPEETGAHSYHQRMEIAVRELLVEKGVVTPAEIRAAIEAMDARSPALGARVVAKAWVDPAFKARLLAEGTAACRELGIDMGATNLCVVENTPEIHNLVVCTLCSCYPRTLLGLPPDWYKSRPYRSRAVREPRAVLAEFGTTLPDSITVRVHDSTADLRYLVLPMRPAGTEGWSEERLAGLVGRDSMIGVALPGMP